MECGQLDFPGKQVTASALKNAPAEVAPLHH